MATLAQVDLQKLWEQVISAVSTPQYAAFLTRTKPLGLLPGEGEEGSNLLLSAPDLFTKDVLETRLRGILTEELSNQLGEQEQPRVGFIVNRSVGGSVSRHLVTRKLRHNFANYIPTLPKQSMLVVRVLKQQNDYINEVASAVEKVITKLSSFNKKADA